MVYGKCVLGSSVMRQKLPVISIIGSFIHFIFLIMAKCHNQFVTDRLSIKYDICSTFKPIYQFLRRKKTHCNIEACPCSLSPPLPSSEFPLPISPLFLSILSSILDGCIRAWRPLGEFGGATPTVSCYFSNQQQPQQHGVSTAGSPKSCE